MNKISDKILDKILDKFINELQLNIHNNDNYNIKNELLNGLSSDINELQLYEYIANTCASYISKEPKFNNLAVNYELKKIYYKTGINYWNLIEKQYNNNLLSDEFYNFVKNNLENLILMIDNSKDYLIDFFGLKTLQRSYLLKNKSKEIIETPQMLWLRTSIQIHGLIKNNLTFSEKLNAIKETYENISNLYFTHATPTLFNSGSKYPQLSSCYLLQCPDDLKDISKTMADMMLISKWAGGIGVNLSDIRANGSLIKSNGGESKGIIPLCKVFESIARYVNQCFAKETIVYSLDGLKQVQEITTSDLLLTKDGSYCSVLNISSKRVNKNLIKIKSMHSDYVLVTEEHQLYVIQDKEPYYINASLIKEGNHMGFPIPSYIKDVILNEEFFRFYGILIMNGLVKNNIFNIDLLEYNLTIKNEFVDTINFIKKYLNIINNNYLHSIDKDNNIFKWYENFDLLPIDVDNIKFKQIDKLFLNLPESKNIELLYGLLETNFDDLTIDNNSYKLLENLKIETSLNKIIIL